MTARNAALLSLLVVVSTFGVVVPAEATAPTVQITSVDSSVSQPAPGERFTLRVDLANRASSSGPVEVTDLYVRRTGTADELVRVTDLGTLGVGEQVAFPLTTSIDRAGETRLTVFAVVRGPDGDSRRVSYPVSLEVREPDETLVSVTDRTAVAGQSDTLNVTVANGDRAAISNLRLTLGGAAGLENPERIRAALAAGTQTTYTFEATFPAAGTQPLVTTLTYTTDEGSTRTVERTTAVDVEPARVDPVLRTGVARTAERTVVEATLEQFGNVDLRDAQLRLERDGEPVARTSLARVPAGEARAATLDASRLSPGEVTVVAAYDAAGERRTLREPLALTSDVALSASSRVLNGSSAVVTELRQFGDLPARDVRLRVEHDGRTVARSAVADVAGGGARTAVLDGSDLPAGDLTVVATYLVGTDRRTVEASVRYAALSPAPTSAVTVTDVAVTRDGGTLRLDGDAANVGTQRVNSVVISVVETDAVSQVAARREFFIGGIDAAQSEGFQATATAPPGVEEVSLRVAYTVGGQRVATVLPVDVRGATAASESGGGDGGSPLLGAALVALVVGLAAGGVYWWRSR